MDLSFLAGSTSAEKMASLKVMSQVLCGSNMGHSFIVPVVEALRLMEVKERFQAGEVIKVYDFVVNRYDHFVEKYVEVSQREGKTVYRYCTSGDLGTNTKEGDISILDEPAVIEGAVKYMLECGIPLV